jgi:hypothetical protein
MSRQSRHGSLRWRPLTGTGTDLAIDICSDIYSHGTPALRCHDDIWYSIALLVLSIRFTPVMMFRVSTDHVVYTTTCRHISGTRVKVSH